MADVEQTEKMIPFITCEVSLRQYVCELVFGVNVFDSGSKLILSNNQSRATLWVLDSCLIVGLLPFIIILITASLSSNTYNKACDGDEGVVLLPSLGRGEAWRCRRELPLTPPTLCGSLAPLP